MTRLARDCPVENWRCVPAPNPPVLNPTVRPMQRPVFIDVKVKPGESVEWTWDGDGNIVGFVLIKKPVKTKNNSKQISQTEAFPTHLL